MENSTTNAIEVIKLSKRFGSKTAVDCLSFEVPRATITGFIGPNGAGKTTTLRMLTTLLNPDSGSIKIFGNDSRQHGSFVRHTIGFMPDYFGLYEDMEVGEYLDFFAAAYNIPLKKREILVNDILALLELSVKKDALVRELSRGMQQRLSLGPGPDSRSQAITARRTRFRPRPPCSIRINGLTARVAQYGQDHLHFFAYSC